MTTMPPNKPRRRIAGETKPGAVAKKPKNAQTPKIPKAPPSSPGVGLPKAPKRSDAPRPTKASATATVTGAPVPGEFPHASSPRSNVVAGFLGIFLGALSAHRIYLGFVRGYVQLALLLLIVPIALMAVFAGGKGMIFGAISALVWWAALGVLSLWGFIEGLCYLAGAPGFRHDAHGRALQVGVPDIAPRMSHMRRSTSLLAAGIAATCAALVFGISGVSMGARNISGDDAGTTREDASDAAAVAAETIFTYQWNKLKQHLSDSKELMTPRFGKKFEDISPALSALAPQRRIQVKAVVRNAATIECGSACADDKAKVLVFIDQARVADGADQPTMFGNRIEMTMVKRNGDWLVDDVKAL